MTIENLQLARQTLGLTSAQLAVMLGVSPDRAVQTFSEWKRRGNTPPTVSLLLEAYLDGWRPKGCGNGGKDERASQRA